MRTMRKVRVIVGHVLPRGAVVQHALRSSVHDPRQVSPPRRPLAMKISLGANNRSACAISHLVDHGLSFEELSILIEHIPSQR